MTQVNFGTSLPRQYDYFSYYFYTTCKLGSDSKIMNTSLALHPIFFVVVISKTFVKQNGIKLLPHNGNSLEQK